MRMDTFSAAPSADRKLDVVVELKVPSFRRAVSLIGRDEGFGELRFSSPQHARDTDESTSTGIALTDVMSCSSEREEERVANTVSESAGVAYAHVHSHRDHTVVSSDELSSSSSLGLQQLPLLLNPSMPEFAELNFRVSVPSNCFQSQAQPLSPSAAMALDLDNIGNSARSVLLGALDLAKVAHKKVPPTSSHASAPASESERFQSFTRNHETSHASSSASESERERDRFQLFTRNHEISHALCSQASAASAEDDDYAYDDDDDDIDDHYSALSDLHSHTSSAPPASSSLSYAYTPTAAHTTSSSSSTTSMHGGSLSLPLDLDLDLEFRLSSTEALLRAPPSPPPPRGLRRPPRYAQEPPGMYSRAERREKILRFKAKKAKTRQNPVQPGITYECRRSFAVTRPRVGGRFIKKAHAQSDPSNRPPPSSPTSSSVECSSSSGTLRPHVHRQLLHHRSHSMAPFASASNTFDSFLTLTPPPSVSSYYSAYPYASSASPSSSSYS